MLMVLGTVAPIFVAFFLDPRRWSYQQAWMIGNPIGLFIEWNNRTYIEKCLTFTGIWGGIVTVMNVPWLVGQTIAFLGYRRDGHPAPPSASP